MSRLPQPPFSVVWNASRERYELLRDDELTRADAKPLATGSPRELRTLAMWLETHAVLCPRAPGECQGFLPIDREHASLDHHFVTHEIEHVHLQETGETADVLVVEVPGRPEMLRAVVKISPAVISRN
jgi:hypothetical protein